MFFGSASSLLRVLAIGVPAFFTMVLLLRLSGKRTVAKFNAFDLIVTVAFGSLLSTALLSSTVSLAAFAAAAALLVLLQFAVAWTSVRFPPFSRLVRAEPRLVFHRGAFLADALRDERLTRGEVLAAIRSSGFATLEDVEAVVLETDGTISVISNTGDGASALRDVRGVPAAGLP